MLVVKEPINFIWDKGNKDKNWRKHKVADTESEETFFDKNKKIFKDKLRSAEEERFIILGETKKKRLLLIVFTMRNKKIRIISARDINRKERKLYFKH